jgi:hypothetical protein
MSARERRDTRYRVRVPVTIVARSGDVLALTDDISFRGAFLRLDRLPPKMQLLQMRFALPPSDAPLVLHGMGVHLVQPGAGDGRPPGVGVEFYGLDGEPRRTWETFVRYIRDTFPESEREPVVRAPAGAVAVVNRRHARHAAELRVEIEPRDALLSFVTENISRGGMFIRTDLALGEGTTVRVHLVHPETQVTFGLECVVRRRVFGTDAGLGVEFANMTDRTRADLARFVSSVVTLDDALAIDIDTSELESPDPSAAHGSWDRARTQSASPIS